ncbi:MAG: hypothetical protein KGN77_02050 [Xanthomonadaceae bacterium]|nr:hypothetical protein [Xanthomonadaceae bacterium]
MTMPRWITRWLLAALLAMAARRPPDVVIGEPDDPYLRRWYVIPRNRVFNAYFHHFLRSDDDRALHDHPWCNASILLRGDYIEHRPGRAPRLVREGGVYLRRASAAHRVELIAGRSVMTLFITGPKQREWGFLCPHGWRHWRDFTAGPRGETIEKGCG